MNAHFFDNAISGWVFISLKVWLCNLRQKRWFMPGCCSCYISLARAETTVWPAIVLNNRPLLQGSYASASIGAVTFVVILRQMFCRPVPPDLPCAITWLCCYCLGLQSTHGFSWYFQTTSLHAETLVASLLFVIKQPITFIEKGRTAWGAILLTDI